MLWDPDRFSGGWIVAKSADFAEWKAAFAELDSAGRGRISGAAAKEDLLKTQLPTEILSKYDRHISCRFSDSSFFRLFM